MEFLTNAAWLIIAVASYVLLIRRIASRSLEHAHGPGGFRSIVALSCALAILFPIISLSDDLQEMQAAVVEVLPSCLIIKKFVVNDPLNPPKRLHQVSSIISPFVMAVGWVSLGGIATQQTVHSIRGPHLSPLCRAPPSLLAIQTS
jgi:hypothetical protein